MTLTVRLYNTTDDPRRVNKTIAPILETLTIHTSEDTSIINPDLYVDYKENQSISRLNFNYAIITSPSGMNSRRYFVTPEISTSNCLILHCKFDPYSSYDLSNVEGFIRRSGKSSGKVVDNEVPLDFTNVIVQAYPFPKSPYRWSFYSKGNNSKSNIYILRTR